MLLLYVAVVIIMLLNQIEKVTRLVPNDGYDLSMKGDYLKQGQPGLCYFIVIVVVHNK